LHWYDKGRKEINYKKDGKFRHPQMQRNGVTLIPTSHGLTMQGVRFAISTDGMNPFANQSSTHSTLLVVLSLYNLPP
jgi:hypothetical protein